MKNKKNIIMTAVAVTTFCSMVFIGGCASGESYAKAGYDFSTVDKVAVVDVAGDIRSETAKNQIADFLAMELMKKGYTPIDRANIQSLLDEQEFAGTDITSTEGAARAGRIANVPMVLVANINYGEQTNITAKMTDVETGTMVWIGSGSGKTGSGLNTIAGAAAGAVGGAAAGGDDKGGRIAGAVGGGILGGVAGEMLTPQQADQVHKIIKKMCEALPKRFDGRR